MELLLVGKIEIWHQPDSNLSLQIVEFENNLDPDEAAHNELPHLGLQCLPFSL